MATIKSYSDLQQSKKLAEFLPLESADMWWNIELDDDNEIDGYTPSFYPEPLSDSDIPCWSLAALLDIIPQEIFDGEYIINITEGCDKRWVLTYDHYENRNHSYYGLSSGADNLIDACVEMIIKLHELKML